MGRTFLRCGIWMLPFLLWADCALRPISEPDLFFYFALIKVYLRDGHWPLTDPFVYTLPQDALVTLHQWLGYWLYYLPYQWFSWAGPIVLKAILVAVFFILPLYPFWRRHRALPAYFAWLWSLTIFTAHHRFRERVSLFGDLFTFLLTAGLLWCSESLWLWCALPALFLVWVQLHPSFPLGWAILAAFFLTRKPSLWRREMIISAILCLAAPFLNPDGIEGVLYPFTFAVDIQPYLTKYVVEWLPLTDSRISGFLFLYIPLFTTIPWLLFRFIQNRHQARIFEWMIFALAILLNWKSVRFGLVAQGLYLILITTQELRRPPKVAPVWASSLLAVLTLLTCGFKFLTSSTLHSSLAQRFYIDTSYFPEAATNDLMNFKPKMRIFNSFGYGGYLSFLWQGQPAIFFHGFSTNFEFYEGNYIRPQENRAELDKMIERYGIGVFLLSKLGNDNGYISLLSEHPGWQKLREDQASVIFVKRDPRVFQ